MPGLEAVLHALASPLRAFADPSSRHYGPALLVALVLAVIVGVQSGHARSLGSYLFSRRVWLHRSAILDYQLVFARPVIRLLVTGPLVISSVVLAARLISLLRRTLGPSPLGEVDRSLVIAIFTVSAFVAEDLVRFLLHVACHRIEPLWALHRLHHSAEVMTPFSVHRVHPLESVLNRAGGALAVGLVAGVCGWLFAGPISGWTILGVDALGLVWNLAGGVLRHSEIPLRYPRWLEHVLVSPAQHQIHHGDHPDQYHRNYGSTFALWDWALGTLATSEGRDRVRFGLPPGLRDHGDGLLSALWAPMANAVLALIPRRWRRQRRGATS
ncbi:MAG: sterol desaturase family protein [Sandaracinaceae bacterium]|nr:sterol desaturase family protein [Sandaracinaceae bacterium]